MNVAEKHIPDPAEVTVLAAETGGTHTRAVLLRADGAERVKCLAAGRAQGANPNAVGAAAAEAWRHALEPLVAVLAGTTVDAACLSCGGGSESGVAAVRELMGGDPSVISDLEAPMWAVTSDGTATVLVAGTGAVAAAFKAGEQVRQTGGWGWWLGDEGSGTWLGRELVRIALADCDGGRATPVTVAVAEHLGVPRLTHADVFTAIYGDHARVARATGQFAPLIWRLGGDPRVDALCERAAAHLSDLVSSGPVHGPVVFAGSVASSDIGRRAAHSLGRSVTIQPHGLAGAAMYALHKHGVVWTSSLARKVAAACGDRFSSAEG